ncbi:hypothetical protein ACOMHN_064261 [Nucella lapillus]
MKSTVAQSRRFSQVSCVTCQAETIVHCRLHLLQLSSYFLRAQQQDADMSKATEKFVDKCKKAFKEADKDNSGQLTIQELIGLIRTLSQNQQICTEIVKEIFLDLDDNMDMKISEEEFAEVFMKKDPKAVKENELLCCFKDFDADGSGKLNSEEILQVFGELGIEGDPQILLDKADKDNDGKVNYEEFLAVWKEG